MTYPDDMAKLVGECGYHWPEDEEDDCEERRKAILVSVVRLTRHWRQQASDAINGTVKERMYQHLNRRLWALHRKLKRVREAAMIWKSGQTFDRLVKLLEAKV